MHLYSYHICTDNDVFKFVYHNREQWRTTQRFHLILTPYKVYYLRYRLLLFFSYARYSLYRPGLGAHNLLRPSPFFE